MPKMPAPDGAPQSLSIVCTGKLQLPDLSPVTPCAACLLPILPGQFYTTVPVGCGADPGQRALARQRLPFRVLAVAVHWPCFQGDEHESHLSLT